MPTRSPSLGSSRLASEMDGDIDQALPGNRLQRKKRGGFCKSRCIIRLKLLSAVPELNVEIVNIDLCEISDVIQLSSPQRYYIKESNSDVIFL